MAEAAVKRAEGMPAALTALLSRFGNKVVTSEAVRRQHANVTTWLPNEPPDAVVYAESTEDVQGVVGIFIMPPSLDVLKARLMNRAQDSPDVIARRLAAAEEEIGHVVEYDYVIINDDFNRAALDLRCIIRTERLKLARHGNLINRLK